jgi:hypothetical protein
METPGTHPSTPGGIGALFTSAALAPLELSRGHLHENRLGDGIRALSSESFTQALARGVEAVAQRVSARPAFIEQILPRAELDMVLAALDKSQQSVLKAIRRQEQTVINFGVPKDVQAVSLGDQLREVASTFSRDKDISAALHTLASDVGRWGELIARIGEGLETDPQLVALKRRRVLLRAGAAGAALVLLAGAVVSAGWLYYVNVTRKAQEEAAVAAEKQAAERAAERIEAAIAQPDPCAPDGLGDDDRKHVSPEQQKRLDGRVTGCAQASARKAREGRCDALAARVEAGQLTADDLVFAQGAAPLLKRVAEKAIVVGDLLAGDAELPCGDTPSSARLWASYAGAAQHPMVWGLADGVSDKVAAVIGARAAELPQAVKSSLAFRAETIAAKAAIPGKGVDPARARALCSLKATLGMALAGACLRATAK